MRKERNGGIFTPSVANALRLALLILSIYLLVSHFSLQARYEEQLQLLSKASDELQEATRAQVQERKELEREIFDQLIQNAERDEELAQLEHNIDLQSEILKSLTLQLQEKQNMRNKLALAAQDQATITTKKPEPVKEKNDYIFEHTDAFQEKLKQKIEERQKQQEQQNPPEDVFIIPTKEAKPQQNKSIGKVNLPTKQKEDTEKKNAVKNGLLHAWNSYKRYAWGEDELHPVSKTSSNWLGQGLTIIDALDTLWIMGEYDEFKLGRDWVEKHLSFNTNRDISVFETTIRILGGLLSAYEFSKDKVFLDRAEELGKILLQAFKSESGLPYATLNMISGRAYSPGWTGGASILSEMGTLQLEFLYLAYHTNKPEYAYQPMKVFKILDELPKTLPGLYPLYIDVGRGQFRGMDYSVGALGDSFYEYMIKLWLLTNKEANGYRRMYEESADGIRTHLVHTSSNGFRYVGNMNGNHFQEKMEHLTCFSGGMYALGYVHNIHDHVDEDLSLGADITKTCHESYDRQSTKIGPEVFDMGNGREFSPQSRYYILRPETVESYFILWRTTHEQKYRDWAWEAFQAIEKHCRVDGGYAGLTDVGSGMNDDTQQTFFLAETLKYLYLIFCDDSVIPIDQYVFNTEAHPLKIFDKPISAWPKELRDTLLLQ